MTQDSPGFILVRIVNKAKLNELIIPQQIQGSSSNKCRDAFIVTDVSLFADETAANLALNRCKLGRPESNLEIRQAVVKLEILS